MKRHPSIEQLCARHHNENLHTEHVARLGLAIFDRVHRRLGIPRRARRLLKGASRLHDIAYSAAPADHARAGARRLLRTGVACFSKEECRAIAAVILLHQKRYEKRLRDPLIRTLPRRRRMLGLAAILRVADGLDHEHVQNAFISSIRYVNGEFRVALRGGSRNVPAAEVKADLWRKVFPHGIVFGGRSSNARPPRSPDSVMETARRLLCVHYRTIADNLPGAAAARSPMPLHDIRVAVRRLCTVLRAFRKPLEGTPAARLADPFARLNSALGPIRDSDVWLAYLRGKKLRRRMAHDKAWRAYLVSCESARRRNIPRFRRLLRSRRVRALMKRAGRACRIDLPDLVRACVPAPIRPFAAAQLGPLFDEIVRHNDVVPGASPDDLHELRKLCRRGRYYGEFFAPALGPLSDDLARRFKRIADPLGRIHDADVALERIAKERVRPPRRLEKILIRRRSAAWKEFQKAWKAIRRRKFVKHVARGL